MKTRMRHLAKAGTYGSKENPQTVTQKDLQEIYESFADMNSSPITLGHAFTAQDPRLGQIVTLELKDGELFGIVEEHDALSKAVDEGFYPDLSIGAKRSADTGKMYLHHVAYLGEEPPAIKNLKSEIKESLAIEASDLNDVQILPSVSTQVSLSDDPQKKGDPNMDELEQVKAKLKEAEEKNAELEKKLSESSSGDAALKAEIDRLTEQLKKLQEKYPDEDINLSDGDPRYNSIVQEMRKTKKESLLAAAKGKIPQALIPKLDALAGNLTMSESIALSDGKKTSGISLLTDIFATMPEPHFISESIALSDVKEGEKPANHARTIMGAL